MSHDQVFSEVLDQLDQFRAISDDVLSAAVVSSGACMDLYRAGAGPRLTGDTGRDRAVTGPVCRSCPVRVACLEWEMRTVGADTTGPWGLLGETDRRDLYTDWTDRLGIPREVPAGLNPGDCPGDRSGGCGGGA